MKKTYFYLLLAIFFIGCSSKEALITIPLKGSQNNIKCKKIEFKSNNPLISNIANQYVSYIILVPKSNKKCSVFIKNTVNKKITNYTKKIQIIYDNKHPRCNFYKQDCIFKANHYFCSNPKTISQEEYNNIKKFKFRYKNYYINDPNSNIAYKIFKRCNPEFIYLHCKKYFYDIKNRYFLNGNNFYLQNDILNFDSCSDTDEIFYDNLTNTLNEIKNYDNYVHNSLITTYENEIKTFIKNNFPNLQTQDIALIDPESSNKKIENIFEKLINKNQIDIKDLNIIKSYLKKVNFKQNPKEYLSLKIIEYTLMLKLKLINQKTKHIILNEINELIKKCKNQDLSDYCNSLYQIKKIIKNIYINN